MSLFLSKCHIVGNHMSRLLLSCGLPADESHEILRLIYTENFEKIACVLIASTYNSLPAIRPVLNQNC